jgi:hypothetical protein
MLIAKDVIILAEPSLIPTEFVQGTCALALTSPPFPMMPPGTNCSQTGSLQMHRLACW